MSAASRRFVSLLALSALLAIPAPAAARPVAYAVVVGNNAPPHDGDALMQLRYADDDAVRYHLFFSRFARVSRLLTVLDQDTQRRYPGLAAVTEEPTLARLRQVVAEIAVEMWNDRARGDQPSLYLAYSGHGARAADGTPFLALLDGGLTETVLYDELLPSLAAEYVHILVDACNAAAVVGVRGGLFGREIDARTTPLGPAELAAANEGRQRRFPSVGVMVATSDGQEAHEWSRIESGVFTHEVLSGLLGAADVNGDLSIEYSELQAFVTAANRGLPDPRAAPKVIARPPRRNENAPLVSLRWLRDATLLEGALGRWGHFFVERANGQRWLDANLGPGTFTVALPAGERLFVRTEREEAVLTTPALSAVPATMGAGTLALRPRSESARGSVDDAYRQTLFAMRYDASYYRGFIDSIGATSVRFAAGPVRSDSSATAPVGRRKAAAVAFAALAGAAGAAALTVGGIAIQARLEFENTKLQQPAVAAGDRYATFAPVAIGLAVGSVVCGIAAAIVWPRADRSTRRAPAPYVRGKEDP